MKGKKWFVYILECSDGSLYTGVTVDVDKRMDLHARGKGSKYVAQKGFRKLLRVMPCLSRSEAQKQEHRIKKLPRREKLEGFFKQ